MEKCAKTVLPDDMTDKRHNDCSCGRYFVRVYWCWIVDVAEVVAGGKCVHLLIYLRYIFVYTVNIIRL